MNDQSRPRFKGAKWLFEASYITDEQRARVLRAVETAKASHPARSVGVRCAAYIGEPSPIAIVTVNYGASIYTSVY